MNRTTSIAMLVASAALAGCEPETITAGPAGIENEANVTNTANVVLPPSIAASKVYRCADNDVVYVDWLSDGTSANIRTEQNGPPTQVKGAAKGEAMTAAGGYSLTGAPDAASVRIAVPGQAEESCKA